MAVKLGLVFAIFVNLCKNSDNLGVSWDWAKWWTYDGISGPQFWGLINPDWSMCTHGRRQSPIDIRPDLLLYDPNLRPIYIDKHKVSGILHNTGHSISFNIHDNDQVIKKKQLDCAEDEGSGCHGTIHTVYELDEIPGGGVFVEKIKTISRSKFLGVNISGGPLSYKYQASKVQLHFGGSDHQGSEHTINGTSFPAEVQIYGYNSRLYRNFSEASLNAYGLVAISVLVQVGNKEQPGFQSLIDALRKIQWKDSWTTLEKVSLMDLLPDTQYYITYEGSQTQPPCHETVTWIVINKPIYISQLQLRALRQIKKGKADGPKGPLRNNFRPTQDLHYRPLRTNIDFTNSHLERCPSMGSRNLYYTVNSWR